MAIEGRRRRGIVGLAALLVLNQLSAEGTTLKAAADPNTTTPRS